MEALVISNDVLVFCANIVFYSCNYTDIVHVEGEDFVETFWQLEAIAPWVSVRMD